MSFGRRGRLHTVDSDRGAWVLGPSVGRADGPWLCAELADRLRGTRGADAPYTVDITNLVDPDVGTVETLARLQLTARRFGHRLQFRVDLRLAGPRLRDLITLTGLEAVLPLIR